MVGLYFFCASEVADFEDVTRGVYQQVLGLYVPVHHVVAVNVVQAAQQLIRVQLDQERVDLLAQFLKVLLDSVYVGRDVVHDNVEQRVLLFRRLLFAGLLLTILVFNFFLVNEVRVAQPHDVLVVHLLVDLELAALVRLVLSDFFNCHNFACALQRAHEHFSEGTNATFDFLSELVLLLQL